MTLDTQIQYMNESKELLDNYQEISSTGKQFQNISDDPGKATIILGLRSSLKVNASYSNTAQTVTSWQSANETAFQNLTDIATQVKNLIAKGSSDTLSATDRSAIGAQLDGLLKQSVDAANTNWTGKYIFSGFQVDKAPFSVDAAQTAVTYNGDHGILQQEISLGQKVDYGIDGSKTFSDFFKTIIAASTAMKTNDMSNINQISSDLSVSMNTIQVARSTNGANQKQVNSTLDSLSSTETEIKSLLSYKEDANMAEAISNLTSQENIYKTVIEVSSRAISALNLFQVMQ